MMWVSVIFLLVLSWSLIEAHFHALIINNTIYNGPSQGEKRYQRLFHTYPFLMRIKIALFISLLFAHDTWECMWCMIYIASIWFLFFDGFLSRLREKSFFYVGFSAPSDIWMRRISRHVNINESLVSAAVKIFLVTLSLAFLIWA